MKKSRIASIAILGMAVILLVNFLLACAPKTTASSLVSTSLAEQTSQTTETKNIHQLSPLLVAYPALSEQFSPFYAQSQADSDVVQLAFTRLLTTDRKGKIIQRAIAGESSDYAGVSYQYRGSADITIKYDEAADQTSYTWKIRDDIYFSNGELMTADDIIFNYYVYCDPDYDGPNQLSTLPLLGLLDYRTQTTAEVYQKYLALFNDIYGAGPAHSWQETDAWSKEQQESVWALIEAAWRQHNQKVLAYSSSHLLNLAEQLSGFTADEILTEEGLQVMASMLLWELADLNETGALLGRASGRQWDLAAGVYPDLDDFYNESYLLYEGNPEAYFYESMLDDESPLLNLAQAEFVSFWGGKDDVMGGQGIPNIAGIKKLSAHEVEVTLAGFDAAAIYQLDIYVAPLSHYGEPDKYDYAKNMFGFSFGDLSGIRAKTASPVGAGPYTLVKYDDQAVYFEANPLYYKGEAAISKIQFQETAVNLGAVAAGKIDLLVPVFNQALVDDIREINQNGQLDGDKIATRTFPDLSYRYVGINAKKVNVAGQPGSEASKNLRRGLATILAACREEAIESFYGELASVLEYPISASSWAAPDPADKGYQAAFSTTLAGTSIYQPDMKAAEKKIAASQAALEYFVAAGYTLDETGKKLATAPEGAKLTYEIIIPGGGKADHPAYELAEQAQKALADLGLELSISDPTDINEMWDALDAGTQELWSAGWKATQDPDLFQVYHSSNIVGLANSSSANSYNIVDNELDDLIMQARASSDQSYRQAAYRICLDIIMDWAVEIPFAQQKNALIFSSERIDQETITPDITPYYSWIAEVEQLRYK